MTDDIKAKDSTIHYIRINKTQCKFNKNQGNKTKKELESVHVLRWLSMSSIPLIITFSRDNGTWRKGDNFIIDWGNEMKLFTYRKQLSRLLKSSHQHSIHQQISNPKKTQINPIPIRKISPKKTNLKREEDDQKFLITWNKTAKRQKIIGIERGPNQRVLLINQSIAHKKKKKRKLYYTSASGRRNEKRLLWERERKRLAPRKEFRMKRWRWNVGCACVNVRLSGWWCFYRRRERKKDVFSDMTQIPFLLCKSTLLSTFLFLFAILTTFVFLTFLSLHFFFVSF